MDEKMVEHKLSESLLLRIYPSGGLALIDEQDGEGFEMGPEERMKLADALNGKIILSLGVLAGKAVTLDLALRNLALEILGHAADLEETATREGGVHTRRHLQTRAEDLRKYGSALWSICTQMSQCQELSTDSGNGLESES